MVSMLLHSSCMQVVVHAGLLDPARGTPPATLLHYSVHSLVDILDFIHQLGESTGEQQAATALVDRLQARMRRIAMDAARLVASTPCSTGGSSMRTSAAALAAGLGSTSSTATVVSAAACGTRGSGRPRVLVLEALAPTPTVAGR